MLVLVGACATTCSVVFSDQNRALSFGRRRNSGVYSHSSSKSVTCCSSGSAPVRNVVVSEPEEKKKKKSLAEELRLGSLAEDGFSYKENFIVRCYEVGINKTATVEAMANFLQEVACNHAQVLGYSTGGFSTTTTMRKLNLIWVTARMHIEIYRYPAWSDVVEIETWGHSEGRVGTRRDWIIRDRSNGEVIGRATSKWVMMNQETRRLQKVSDDVRDEYLGFCPKTPRFAFPEEGNNSTRKIRKLEDPAHCSRLGLTPRRVDLDMNQHVNNVAYIGWILESMPQEVLDTHELQAITLDYRRECQHNDIVDSLTSPESDEDVAVTKLKQINGYAAGAAEDVDDFLPFLHLLRLSNDGLEINRSRTVWRKKQNADRGFVSFHHQ